MNVFTYSHVLVLLRVIYVSGQQVCYDHLGCFSTGPPWISSLRPVSPPNDPNQVPVYLQLFTRQNPKNAVGINIWPHIDMEPVDSHFKQYATTVIYIHGWKGTSDNADVKLLKDTFLHRIDCNVIAVYWQEAATYSYLLAVSDTRIVAAKVARFLRALMERYGYSACKFHLIGFSIGAHVASYVAKETIGICRLTALEPSSLFFDGFDASIRVNSTDAKFVEVIHTTGHPLIGAGIHTPIGDVDYYMNGGWIQPGCSQDNATGNYTVRGLLEVTICYHFRSLQYYKEAIINPNCLFWGKRRNMQSDFLSVTATEETLNNSSVFDDCDLNKCIPMGLEAIEYPARGSFDVVTSSTPPFCINRPHVSAKMKSELEVFNDA